MKLTEEQSEAIARDLREFLFAQIDRMSENLGRVQTLISLYKVAKTDSPPSDKGTLRAEILRAAVVFLHASVEDFLRTLARLHLPQASPEKLNKIPLASVARSRNAEKFLLGELARFRGKTVNEVIEESVALHLERATYNNARDVIEVTTAIGVEKAAIKKFLPKLDRMMKRRHQIVHRADRSSKMGGETKSTAISSMHVEAWLSNAHAFMKTVVVNLMAQKLIGRVDAERKQVVTNES